MNLETRLVDQPHSLLDGLFVDFDDQAAQELVKVILQTVFFGVSDFNGELHRFLAFNRALLATGAWIVPERGGQKSQWFGGFVRRGCLDSEQRCRELVFPGFGKAEAQTS